VRAWTGGDTKIVKRGGEVVEKGVATKKGKRKVWAEQECEPLGSKKPDVRGGKPGKTTVKGPAIQGVTSRVIVRLRGRIGRRGSGAEGKKRSGQKQKERALEEKRRDKKKHQEIGHTLLSTKNKRQEGGKGKRGKECRTRNLKAGATKLCKKGAIPKACKQKQLCGVLKGAQKKRLSQERRNLLLQTKKKKRKTRRGQSNREN